MDRGASGPIVLRIAKSRTELSGNHLLIHIYLGFPGGSVGKESACNMGDLGLIPGLGRPSG